MSPQTLDILEAPLAYEEAMTTLFLPESGNILAKTIQVLRGCIWSGGTDGVLREPLGLMGRFLRTISPGC